MALNLKGRFGNTFKQNGLGISLNARLIAMRESAEKIIAKRAKEEEIALQDRDNRDCAGL